MASHHYVCCCTPAAPNCCDLWECVEVCDDYEIVHTWEEYAHVGSQVLLLSRATYRFTTQGTRTEAPGDPACEEHPQSYSWEELRCEVTFEAFDYVSRSQSACFENTSPTAWQSVDDACGVTGLPPGPCRDACVLAVGCEAWPDPVALLRPDIGFYRQYQTHKYEFDGVIQAGDCFDDLDPISLTCDAPCGECKRLKFKLWCPNFDQTGWNLIPGLYNRRQTPECDPDIVDQASSFAIEPWELASDCACNGRPLWKNGVFGANWVDAIIGVWSGPFTNLRGTLDGYHISPNYNLCQSINDGVASASGKIDYAWSCSRPAQGENCPNADAVYQEIAFQMAVDVRMTWSTAVTCA
jgi:hypothetical protein